MNKLKKWMAESMDRTAWVVVKLTDDYNTPDGLQILDSDDVKEVLFPNYPGVMKNREFTKALDVMYERDDHTIGGTVWRNEDTWVAEIDTKLTGDRYVLMVDHSGGDIYTTSVGNFMAMAGVPANTFREIREWFTSNTGGGLEVAWEDPKTGGIYFSWDALSTEGAVYPLTGYIR